MTMNSTAPIQPSEAPSFLGIEPDIRVKIVLCPTFSLVAFGSFVDSLRMSADEEEYSRQIYCRWQIVADDWKTPIAASCGAQVFPQGPLGSIEDITHLVVVGGIGPNGRDLTEETRAFISSAYMAGVSMVGLCTGSFVLADLGLLDGRRCALHPAHLADFRDRYPRAIPVTGEMYVNDRNVITSPGGISGLDVAFHLVEEHCGKARAVKGLSLMLFNDYQSRRRFRGRPYGNLAACGNPKVEMAIELMERSIARPYSISRLASRVGCSERELSRLFSQYGNTSPSRTWRNMRTAHGHWLLLNSNHSLAQITNECGFTDSSHFSRWFKEAYHESPEAFRRRRRQAPAKRAESVRTDRPVEKIRTDAAFMSRSG